MTETEALPISAMCTWLDENAERILTNKSDAKGHDLWVVTRTYSVPRRALAVLHTNEDRVQLTLDANAAGVGRAGASASWWSGLKDAAWIPYEHVSTDLDPCVFCNVVC